MKRKHLIVGLVIIILSFSQVYTQRLLEKYQFVEKESILYLPSGKYIKTLALGYDQMLADLLWMKTVSYFGSHYMTDKEYPWLYHILTLIIDLDPLFDFPYLFGGIVLSLEASQFEQANDILKKGMEAYPNKWEYPFYIGFNHYYHQGDSKIAIPYMEKASSLPNVPDFVKSLVGTLYLKTGEQETALQFFREAYRNTNDEMVKKKIAEKIEELLSKRKNNDAGH